MLIISALGKVYIDKKKSTIGVRIANIPLQIVFFFLQYQNIDDLWPRSPGLSSYTLHFHLIPTTN